MYAKKVALGTAVLAGCLASGPVAADLVKLQGITARWFDGNPTANVDYYQNDTTTPSARWGRPAYGGGQSGYDFTVAAQPIEFEVPSTPLDTEVIGTFVHQNFPILSGTSITDIKLEITADVYVGSSQVGNDLQFTYGFDHWETPNSGSGDPARCADGGIPYAAGTVNESGCADRVIASWLPTSATFKIGDKEYTLNVTGFSLDPAGTSPFTSFWTTEGRTNTAYLLANVDLKENVVPPGELPEPPALALLGVGLAGIGYARRRSRRPNSR